jgi:hypothetical protein
VSAARPAWAHSAAQRSLHWSAAQCAVARCACQRSTPQLLPACPRQNPGWACPCLAFTSLLAAPQSICLPRVPHCPVECLPPLTPSAQRTSTHNPVTPPVSPHLPLCLRPHLGCLSFHTSPAQGSCDCRKLTRLATGAPQWRVQPHVIFRNRLIEGSPFDIAIHYQGLENVQ